MDVETFESELRQYVVDNFLFGDESIVLADDTSFLETGKIDSTGVIELIGYLEDSCGITIADEEVVPDNLDSIAKIARFVRAKRSPS